MKKKNLLWTLAAAFALASCSETELVEMPPQAQEQNAIAFSTYLGDNAQSRAVVMDEKLLGVEGFGVNAYYTKDTKFANYTADKPNFMTNTKVTYDKDKAVWTYSPVKYWPNNTFDDDGTLKYEMVSFLAYGPYANGAGVNNIALAENGTELTFTVNEEVKNQVDLIYNNQTTAPTTDLGKQAVNERILFKFDHALARIAFTVEAAVDEVNGSNLLDGNTRINVKKVVLMGENENTNPFYATGKLNLINGTWTNTTTDDSRKGFTFDGGRVDGDGSDNEFYHTVEDLDAETKEEINVVQLTRFNASEPQRLLNDSSYLMVIPQETAFKIYIEYDVISGGYENNGGGVYDQSAITNKITKEIESITFEKGMAYNFNLVLGMTSVKFEVDEVTAWDETTPDQDVWLPENTTEKIQGLGTEDNPYEIRSLANLIAMRDNINGNENAAVVPDGGRPWADAVYKQINDVTVTSATRASESWEPVNEFKGTYLGNGKKIIGLTINNSEDTTYGNYYAWIAKNSGTIQDLTMENVNITSVSYAAAIVGENNGTITNCIVDGELAGKYAGGLAYWNDQTISDCTNLATFADINYAGGITCYNQGQIVNCKNEGDIIHNTEYDSDSSSQGGIAACNYESIENCQNFGDITGMRVGGIIGSIYSGEAIACYNGGDVKGLLKNNPGGITGMIDGGAIIACYNHGAVAAADGASSSNAAGGIVGWIAGTDDSHQQIIKGCYHNNEQCVNCGGLVGYRNSNSILASEGNYYAGVTAAYGHSPSQNTDIATKVDGSTVTWADAKTAMNNVLNVLYADGTNPQYDWKYVGDTTTEPLTLEAGVADYVALPDTEDEIPAEGYKVTENIEEGTITYTVYTADGLYAWRAAVMNEDESMKDDNINLVLAADITLPEPAEGQEYNWKPVGGASVNSEYPSYKGNIDGGSYTITNLVIKSGNPYSGFIGKMEYGTIKNLKLAEVNIQKAAYETVAALLGDGGRDMTIYGCEVVSGTVNGDAGLIGAITSSTVENCINRAAVTNRGQYAGGVICNASLECTIDNCSNYGNVSLTSSGAPTYYAGGIVGYLSSSTAKNCTNYCTSITPAGHVGYIVGTAENSCTLEGNKDEGATGLPEAGNISQ